MRRYQSQRLFRLSDKQFLCDKTYNSIGINDRVAFATKSAGRVYLRLGIVKAFMYDPVYDISYIQIKSDSARIVYRHIVHPFVRDVIVITKSDRETESNV